MVGLLLVHGAMALLLLLLGIVLFCGKGLWLIAGYNASSPEEKAKTDEKALGRCVGRLLFFCAGCFVLLMVSTALDSQALMWLGIGLFIAGILAGVVYMNTGNRFQKDRKK